MGDKLLSIFKDLNLIKERILELNENNTIKNIRLIEFTAEGKEIFIGPTKTEHYPYYKLPMFHPPYFIENGHGIGYFPLMKVKDVNDSIVRTKITGCSVIKTTLDLDRALNYLSNIPYNINYELYLLYYNNFIQRHVTNENYLSSINTSLLQPNTLILLNYILSPAEENSHIVRVRYIMTRLQFMITLFSIVICNVHPNIKDTETNKPDIKALISLLSKNCRFYSPVFLDSRTRINSTSQIWLSGAEFERSLFLPVITKKLTKDGAEALINYLLCLYGKDLESGKQIKPLSWNNKITNFFNNITHFSNFNMIKKAKKPYLYTTIIHALNEINFWNNPKLDYLANQNIKVGVFLDNTSSGCQILSTLVGDLTNASLLNLKDQTLQDPVGDLYQYISDCCNNILYDEDKLKIYNIDAATSNWLKEYGVTNFFVRGLVKEPVMASIYGITRRKVKSLIFDYLQEMITKTKTKEFKAFTLKNTSISQVFKDFSKYRKNENLTFIKSKKKYRMIFNSFIKNVLDPNLRDTYNKTILNKKILNSISDNLADLLMRVIRETLPKMFDFYNAVIDYARSLAEINESVEWETLTGDAKICQAYKKIKIKKIRLLSHINQSIAFKKENFRRSLVRRGITLKKITDKFNIDKSVTSLMANLTHSFDACLLRRVINKLQDYQDFEMSKGKSINRILQGTIHDSFFINPADVEIFLSIYKEAYISVFSQQNIDNFLRSLKGSDTHLNMQSTADRKKFDNVRKNYLIIQDILKKSSNDRITLLNTIKGSKYIIYF
jgi:hypothetical protein